MALIDKLACDRCAFETEETAGSFLYTVTEGRETVLGHPVEGNVLKRVTGLEWHEARDRGLIRAKHYCICYACCEKFYLDIDRREKQCPSCKSNDVRTFSGAIAEPCPSCQKGILKLISIGIS